MKLKSGATSRRCLLAALCAGIPLLGLGANALADNDVRWIDVPSNPYFSGPAHWDDGAGGGPGFVTLVDKTPTAWPVRAAADEWDHAGRLNIIYQYGDCGGYGHCVSVDNRRFTNFTCRENGGKTAFIVRPSGHLDPDSFIELNQRCADSGQHTRLELRGVVCDEQGHIAGLSHADYAGAERDTCMADAPGVDSHHKPRRHDFEMLDDRIYDHRD